MFLSSVRDGVFRQYHGARTLDGLKNYIEFQDWKRTEPVSAYGAPDSFPYVDIYIYLLYLFLIFIYFFLNKNGNG